MFHGPHRIASLQSQTANGAGLESSGLAERIRKNGMQAHPYTFRNEARYLSYGSFASAMDEFEVRGGYCRELGEQGLPSV